MSVDDDYLPVREAAREFGLHRGTIFQWISEGLLRGYERKGDRRTFVSRAELAELTKLRPKENGGPSLLSLLLLLLPLVHGPRSALSTVLVVACAYLLETLTGSGFGQETLS